MARSNQGGSILGFIIIGGVLTALLVGGAYIVQRQTSDDIIATQPSASQSSEEAEEKPAPTPKPEEAAPAPEEEADKPEVKEENKAKPAPAAPAAPQKDDSTPPPALPKTGPAETFASVLGAGFLSAATLAYIRSRR